MQQEIQLEYENAEYTWYSRECLLSDLTCKFELVLKTSERESMVKLMQFIFFQAMLQFCFQNENKKIKSEVSCLNILIASISLSD